jgi:hypothetical protein
LLRNINTCNSFKEYFCSFPYISRLTVANLALDEKKTNFTNTVVSAYKVMKEEGRRRFIYVDTGPQLKTSDLRSYRGTKKNSDDNNWLSQQKDAVS